MFVCSGNIYTWLVALLDCLLDFFYFNFKLFLGNVIKCKVVNILFSRLKFATMVEIVYIIDIKRYRRTYAFDISPIFLDLNAYSCMVTIVRDSSLQRHRIDSFSNKRSHRPIS